MSSADSAPQQSTTDLLKNAQFAKAGAGVVPDAAPVSASDLLASAYDPARLHPLAGISDQVDYLMLDDDKLTDLPGSETAIPSRGWSDDLCYGTGTMYLGGVSSTFFTERFVLSIALFNMLCILSASLIFTSYCLAYHHMLTHTTHRSGFGWPLGSSGGLQPAPRNVKRPPANQCHPKLGYTTRDFHGQFCRSSRYVLSGTFPVFCLLLSVCLIALSYNAINSAIDGVRGRHDAYGSMAAGALTGALYKSTGTSQIGRDAGLN